MYLNVVKSEHPRNLVNLRSSYIGVQFAPHLNKTHPWISTLLIESFDQITYHTTERKAAMAYNKKLARNKYIPHDQKQYNHLEREFWYDSDVYDEEDE